MLCSCHLLTIFHWPHYVIASRSQVFYQCSKSKIISLAYFMVIQSLSNILGPSKYTSEISCGQGGWPTGCLFKLFATVVRFIFCDSAILMVHPVCKNLSYWRDRNSSNWRDSKCESSSPQRKMPKKMCSRAPRWRQGETQRQTLARTIYCAPFLRSKQISNIKSLSAVSGVYVKCMY